MSLFFVCFLFFFNDTATTEIYTLSLHDALPILNKKTREKTQPKKPPSPPEELKPEGNKSKEGFVYYIQEEMDGNIKIGWSDDPIKRLTQHQTSNSRELRMLVYVKGSQEYEREIHRK